MPTTAKKATAPKAQSTKVEPTESVVVNTQPEVKEKRVFAPSDPIPCRSIFVGTFLAEGVRSKILYTWADYGDVEPIEYQDLIYFLRSKASCLFTPYLIVEDEDFIEQNPQLNAVYESMYTTGDLMDILNLPEAQMIAEINNLPEGCKNAIKNLAGKMILNGSFDSARKIKAIDKYFDTQYLLMMAQN